MLNLLLKIKDKQALLYLKRDNEIIDEIQWPENRDLLEKLFLSLDKILKKNSLDIRQIEDFDLAVDMDKNYSTYRIAQAAIDTFKFSFDNNFFSC